MTRNSILAFVVLAEAVVSIVILVGLLRPYRIDDVTHGGQVAFWTPRSLGGDVGCMTVYWQVSGIERLFLDQKSQLEEGHQEVCVLAPDPLTATFTVQFRDDTWIDYSLHVDPSSWQIPAIGIILGNILILGAIAGSYVNKLSSRIHRWLLKRWFLLVYVACGCLLVVYYVQLQWTPGEAVRFLAGAGLLWGPLGALIYLLTQPRIQDKLVCLTFSFVSSYTLTTLVYFGLAELRLDFVFYVWQGSLAVYVVYLLVKRKVWQTFSIRRWLRSIDSVMLLIIALSLYANIPFNRYIEPSPDASGYVYFGFPDHLYHAGLEYQLALHVPPLQSNGRGGSPERAYHMFPHLTTVLLDEFTGQPDMLRAHLVYHYLVIEILLCLCLYSIVRTLTGSRHAGYVAAACLYLFVVAWPSLDGNHLIYFTLFPHASSGWKPVALTSPQMYSGLVVMYGILLGVTLAYDPVEKRWQGTFIPLLIALMTAASMRFRLHVFLVMAPALLILLAYSWWRTRRLVYPLLIGVMLIASALLYLEMQLPSYATGSANFQLGYNEPTLPKSFLNEWPLSESIRSFLKQIIPSSFLDEWPLSESIKSFLIHTTPPSGLFKWVWQFTSLSAFLLFNEIGFPLLAATLWSIGRKPALPRLRLLGLLGVWSIVASVIGAALIKTDFDNYSIGGQLLLHVRWYLFPLGMVAFWLLLQRVDRYLHWRRLAWLSAGILVCVGTMILGQNTLAIRPANVVMSNAEWSALQYLHDNTPRASVILTNRFGNAGAQYEVSGLTGRAAYLENPGNIIDLEDSKAHPDDDRVAMIDALWHTRDSVLFCRLLTSTPATHVLEFAQSPLLVKSPPCLKLVWQAQDQTVSVWQIQH